MKKWIMSMGVLLVLGSITACSQGGERYRQSSTENVIAITANTSEENKLEESSIPKKFEYGNNIKKVKSMSEIDEESIINGEIGYNQMLAGGNLDGNTYQYSCKKFTGVQYPVILNTTEDQEIEIRSQLTMEDGEAQAYLLTADQKLIKILDGTENYSLKKGNNYLVLTGFKMKGKYESQIIADNTVQIVSEAEVH